MDRPTVWFVDDLQSNLDAFVEAHGSSFNVEVFLHTQDVLDRLRDQQPDALLCDIFFYDTPEEADRMEADVKRKLEELRAFGQSIHATSERYTAGIDLIAAVRERLPESEGSPPRFPVYAYTSKGPFLLGTPAWNRIAENGAKVLLKNSFGREAEGMVLRRDIRHYRTEVERHAAASRFGTKVRRALIGMGILGAALGVLIDRLVTLLMGL